MKPLWTSVLLFLFVTPTTLARAQSPQAELAGFAIAKPDGNSRFDQSMIPGYPAGLQVIVNLKAPEHHVIDVTAENANLKLTDSEGGELKLVNDDFGFLQEIAEDANSAMVRIRSERIPASGTKFLQLSGNVVVTCGTELTSSETAFAAQVDSEVTVGNVPAKLTSLESSFMEEGAVTLEFESSEKFDFIQSLTVITKSGRDIESKPSGSSKWGFNDQMTYTQSFDVKVEPADIAKLKVSFFRKTEEVKIPCAIKFGLGLDVND